MTLASDWSGLPLGDPPARGDCPSLGDGSLISVLGPYGSRTPPLVQGGMTISVYSFTNTFVSLCWSCCVG